MNQIYVRDLDNKWNICHVWSRETYQIGNILQYLTALLLDKKQYLSTTTYDGMWELYKVQLLLDGIKLCLSSVSHAQGIMNDNS